MDGPWWGEDALELLGDEGAHGLHVARKVIQERIVHAPPNDDLLSDYIAALNAIEVVLDAIGKLEPRSEGSP